MMKKFALFGAQAAAAGCVLMLAACGGGGGSGALSNQDEDPGSSPPTGILSGGITDAAIDEVTAVNLRVLALQLRLQDADEDDFITIDLTDEDGNAIEFNLLDYQNGEVFPLFENEVVPAGVYEHARLMLEAPAQTPGQCRGQDPLEGSHVELVTGGFEPIFVPSAANTGVKLVSPFRVPENGEVDLIIDFDLRQALHRPPPFNCYFLRPTYRVDVAARTGRIAGTVDSLLMDNSNGLCSDDDPATGNAVYVYEGADQIPGDINAVDDERADPYATAAVSFDPLAGPTGQGEFFVGFLPPGEYTIAFTCRADQERIPNPDSDDLDEQEGVDELDFQQPQTVTVEVGETTLVEFVDE
jgi:hypothetical protein